MGDGVLVVDQDWDLVVREVGSAGISFRPLALVPYWPHINPTCLGIRQGLGDCGTGETIGLDQDLLFRAAYDIGHKFRGAAIGRKGHVDSSSCRSFIALIGFNLIGKGGDRGYEGQKQQP